MDQKKIGLADPLISIVIPVYNNELYLHYAVGSVLNQEHDSIEIVIVDDGSTDNTPQLVDDLARKHMEIRTFHQKNQWIYAAMNKGVQEARGEYVYILNSDDCLFGGSIKSMIEIVQLYSPDVVWTRIHCCDFSVDNGFPIKTLFYEDWSPKEDVILQDLTKIHELFPKLFFNRIAWNQANLYRRELLEKHPFRNDVYGGDVFFNLDIAEEITSMIVMKEPVYQFNRYKTSEQNASIGKYYSYEHDMFNEIYIRARDLFTKWDMESFPLVDELGKMRIKQITREVRSYGFKNCPYDLNEKIKRILTIVPDNVVISIAVETGRVEEMESRILAGIEELLRKEDISKNDEMGFVKYLVQLRFNDHINETPRELFVDSIENKRNPAHIGKCFLKKYLGT